MTSNALTSDVKGGRGNIRSSQATSLVKRPVHHGRDSDSSHVTRVVLFRFRLWCFSQCHVEVKSLEPEKCGTLTLPPLLSFFFLRKFESSPPHTLAMADGERSPLLSEQHDGSNGLSPGGSSLGYPSKPQSMSLVLFVDPDRLLNILSRSR